MSIGNLGSCRCTKQTQRRLHFCIVTRFARGAAPCVCALVHQCGRDSIGFDPLRPGLAVIRINPDRSVDTALIYYNGQEHIPQVVNVHVLTMLNNTN